MKKIVFLVFVLGFLSTAVFAGFVSPVGATGTIYVRSDGSVDPATTPIQRIGNIYNFTENIYDEIVVERDNIVVDGAGYTLQGTGSGTGIDLSETTNVTIRNMEIKEFLYGAYLYSSLKNSLSGNNVTNNEYGIRLRYSSNNNVSRNNITNNDRGIYLRDSSNNNIYGNTITNNDRGIYLYRSSENIFYHNNFIDNTEQVYVRSTRENVWDDGYPSGGNYWSDYTEEDADGDGIGDTEYFIDYINRDRYPLMSHWGPPIISIISPENRTYAVTSVPLVFTVSEAASWMGYSLDGQVNVTVSGNTTLVGLSDGVHSFTVYANDTAGNMGHSDTVYFTINALPPNIELFSPENKTYITNSVSLSFTVNEAISWIGYSLDGQANNTILGNTTLIGLSDGPHSLIVYASDIVGNIGSSDTVYFTIDTALPTITILSPETKTYDTTYIPLSFTVNEPVSLMAYSLDGQANVTITRNVTLTLPDGLHYVVVYANDAAGNMGASGTVYFSVDSVGPSILLVSPTNTVYASTSVPLRFVIYEIASWMGYSLDGQVNVTVSGNTTLVGLSDGVHSFTVYANDTAGNMGHSDTVYFTINALPPNIELFSPENKTYAVTDVSLVFTVSEAASWMGYSLDGQVNVTVSGNTTLVGLSDGVHSFTVYANDTAGNMGHSDTVYFTINALPPNIELFSPENKTYITNSVSLSFSVSTPAFWIRYSLDGQANVTIFGDITLSGLSEGSHSVVVYFKDAVGNVGASGLVYFTVETQRLEPSQLWVVAVIAVIAGVGFALTGYMAYDLFKRAKSDI